MSTSLAFIGLILTLSIARRRAWVRASTDPAGRTIIEYGLLARGKDHGLAKEALTIGAALSKHWDTDTHHEHQLQKAGRTP